MACGVHCSSPLWLWLVLGCAPTSSLLDSLSERTLAFILLSKAFWFSVHLSFHCSRTLLSSSIFFLSGYTIVIESIKLPIPTPVYFSLLFTLNLLWTLKLVKIPTPQVVSFWSMASPRFSADPRGCTLNGTEPQSYSPSRSGIFINRFTAFPPLLRTTQFKRASSSLSGYFLAALATSTGFSFNLSLGLRCWRIRVYQTQAATRKQLLLVCTRRKGSFENPMPNTFFFLVLIFCIILASPAVDARGSGWKNASTIAATL